MTKYPRSFPIATIDGYGIDVNMGVVRTDMEKGNSRQRRRFRTMPQMFNAQFPIERSDLNLWQMWVNNHAYDWFELPLVSYISTGKEPCTPHVVRFASDLQLSPINENAFLVTVVIEQAEASLFFNPPATLTGQWLIGGTPPAPSSDWVIAGTPSSPSPDWIIAGRPAHPAALI